MALGFWKKVSHRLKDKDCWGSDSDAGTSGSGSSSAATSRVPTFTSSGHGGSESDLMTSVNLGSPEWLTFSKSCFESAWAYGRGESADLSDFLQVKVLANGCFGPIVLLRQYDSGDYFVLKVLEKQLMFKHNQVKKAEAERRILAAVNFPFIVNLKYQGQDSANLYLFMEYLPGGDVWHLMQRQRLQSRGFGEGQVRFYVSQVILALEYLHHMDLVCRDLKPENIFIDATGYLKLGDFGCSKRLRNDGRAMTQCGTRDYMPPEIVSGQAYNRAVDYWSLGVLIYEFVVGETPFFSENKMETYEKIVSGKYNSPKVASKEVKDLIKKLLVVDACRRLGHWKHGFGDVKGHEWFTRSKFNWEDIFTMKAKAPFVPQLKSGGDTKYFMSVPKSDRNNNKTSTNPHHLFKQQESPVFIDYFDKYFDNF